MQTSLVKYVLNSITAIATLATLSSCQNSLTASTGTTTDTTGTRTIDAYTTSGTVHGNCALKTRTTTSCDAARTALGFTGNWLKFSCNITLGLLDSSNSAVTSYSSATWVTLTYVNLPEHRTNYYPTTGTYSFTANSMTVTGNYSDMYIAYSGGANPSLLGQKSYVLKVPKVPNTTSTSTSGLGTVGLTIDGLPVFDSAAAGSDNIFSEASTFDECQGHPNSIGYHFHTEPWSLSYDDNNLIGIMRDGYWIYGRREFDNSTPSYTTSDSSDSLWYWGGHTGADPQTGTGNDFHYHVTAWTTCVNETRVGGVLTRGSDDGSPTCTSGQVSAVLTTAYFLTGHGSGGIWKSPPAGVTNSTTAVRYFRGAPGTCTGGCN